MATAGRRARSEPIRGVMSSPRPKPSNKLLDAMIEEATVDAYNDEEQITGLFTMLEEHLALPFQHRVLGVTVTVTKIDLTAATRSSRSAAATLTSRRSRSSTYRSPTQRLTASNGSTPTAAGAAERNHHLSAVAIIRSRRTEDPASTARIATDFR